MINLRSFKREQELAMPDLLPYAVAIEEGIIMNKDGSYMASWFYTGKDDNSMTADERDYTNERINGAFRRLGSGWVIHTNAIRLKSDIYPNSRDSHFPDPITELIDEERRDFFEAEGNSFETIYTITLTYTPEPVAQNKAESLFYSTEGGKSDADLGDKTLNTFKKAIREFQDNLSIVLDVRRMRTKKGKVGNHEVTYDEQLSLIDLHFHQEEFRDVILPDIGMYMDSYVGRHQFATGVIPKIGNKFISVISIEGFPSATSAGILNQLSELGIEFRWNTRFIPLDAYHANAEITKYTRKWAQKVKGLVASLSDKPNAKINRNAAVMTADAEMAESDASGDHVTFGYYTGNIVLLDADQEFLTDAANAIRKALVSLGFTSARIEDINCVEAWLGTFPANSAMNIRRPLIHSLNLADLSPTSSVYAGEACCPCDKYPENAPPLAMVKTEGSTPFRLNLHVSDLGHTLIFGATGSGKSTLLAFLTTQMLRYPDMNIACFDKGMSMYAINQAVGGTHYNIGGEDKSGKPSLAFAPLSRIENNADFEWAIEWVELLCELQFEGEEFSLSMEHKLAIREAMETHRHSEYKTLADFRTQVQNQEVKNALSFYASNAAYNAETDSLVDGHFEVFEIEELMNFNEKISLPILLYLFRCIERKLSGQPSFIIIDEAWMVLGHPSFREKIREWLKVLRKANCAVVLATQSISDAQNSGILDVLVESCPTKIFLPNPKATSPEGGEAYKGSFDLNLAQRNIIADAIPKKQYFITSPKGDRLVDLALGNIQLAFCTKSSKQDIASLKDFQTQYGSEWPLKWIEHHTPSST
jgi:type IV secretion system protein VirB4